MLEESVAGGAHMRAPFLLCEDGLPGRTQQGGLRMRDQDLELLRIRLQEIKEMGWVKNQRPGNAGGVGNTLEDLLDVAENNLQLPDFGNWELKS